MTTTRSPSSKRCTLLIWLAFAALPSVAGAQLAPLGAAESVLRVGGHEAVLTTPLVPLDVASCWALARATWGATDAGEAETFVRGVNGADEVACFGLPPEASAESVVAQLPGGMVGDAREDAVIAVWSPPLLRGERSWVAVLRVAAGDVMLVGATPAPSAAMQELFVYLDEVFTVALDRVFGQGAEGLPPDCVLGYEAGGVRVEATHEVPLTSCRVHGVITGEDTASVWIDVVTGEGERLTYP